MYIAFDVNQTREYQLKAHRDPEDPVFILGAIDSGLQAHLNDSKSTYLQPKDAGSPAEIKMHLDTHDREVVRFGLRGVRNLKNSKGDVITFETHEFSTPVGLRKGLKDSCLDFIKPDISELAAEIEKDNTLTEKDAKN